MLALKVSISTFALLFSGVRESQPSETRPGNAMKDESAIAGIFKSITKLTSFSRLFYIG